MQVGDTIEMLIDLDEVDATQYFIGTVNNSGSANGGVRFNGTSLLVYLGLGSVNTVDYTPNGMFLFKIEKASETSYLLYADGVYLGESGTGGGDFNIYELGSRNGSYYFKGCISNFKMNEKIHLNIAEGGVSDTCYNLGSDGGDASIFATLDIFWGSTQSMHHYNYRNGFDLWENGTAGEEIRVPINTNVVQSGYSFTDTFPAVIGLNNCETKIDISDVLGFAYDPLAYLEFQKNFDSENKVYSCIKDKNHNNLRFYSIALSDVDNTKMIKCLKAEGC